MNLSYSIKSASTGLLAHKSRTALTILGIVIGITAIMLIAAIGKGAENLILGEIQSLGSNIVAVIPGQEPNGPTAAAESLHNDSLKQRELDALSKKSNVPDAVDVMPVVFDVESVSYGGETYRPTIIGASEQIAKLFGLSTSEGVFLNSEDVKNNASVAVIGSKVKTELFGEQNAIGEKIRINDRNIRVIGVLPPKGQVLFFNMDEAVLMPYTTAQEYIFGIKYFNRIIIQTNSELDSEKTAEDARKTLRELHNINDPDNDDFFVETQEGLANTLTTVTSAIALFLGSVAAIALIVGGIGIMNILLVSIAERTREIGLRKAVGATNRNILTQFLFESVLLTTIGGVIGIILGTVLSIIASSVLTVVLKTNWLFSFPTSAAVTGLLVSALIGLIFGIYPARKAALKSPIEALSYE